MAEILHEHLGLSTAEAALAMKISRQALHRVVSQAGALTPEMSLRFCKFVGGYPEMFLKMQEAHDLWAAKKRISAQLSTIRRAIPTSQRHAARVVPAARAKSA